MTEKPSTKLTKYTFDAEEVSKSFSVYRKSKEEIEEKLLAVNVTDEQSLQSAQLTFNRGKEMKDEIVKFSNELKSPFSETVNRIQSYFNAFIAPLSKNLDIASGKMLNFKTMESERLKEEANTKLEEVDKEFQVDLDNFNKLSKLCETSLCRIFGGTTTIGGKPTLFTQLNSIPECQHMRTVFEQKFPNPNSFGKYSPNVTMVKELSIQAINEIELGLKKNNLAEMPLGKLRLEEKFNLEMKKEAKRLDKEKKTQVKSIISASNIAMKGTRKTIAFQVLDMTKVPLTYLEVDEKAIQNYIASNREEIKAKLEENQSYEPIPGIKFYNNVTVVKS